jgi:hypothetical protein
MTVEDKGGGPPPVVSEGGERLLPLEEEFLPPCKLVQSQRHVSVSFLVSGESAFVRVEQLVPPPAGPGAPHVETPRRGKTNFWRRIQASRRPHSHEASPLILGSRRP